MQWARGARLIYAVSCWGSHLSSQKVHGECKSRVSSPSADVFPRSRSLTCTLCSSSAGLDDVLSCNAAMVTSGSRAAAEGFLPWLRWLRGSSKWTPVGRPLTGCSAWVRAVTESRDAMTPAETSPEVSASFGLWKTETHGRWGRNNSPGMRPQRRFAAQMPSLCQVIWSSHFRQRAYVTVDMRSTPRQLRPRR